MKYKESINVTAYNKRENTINTSANPSVITEDLFATKWRRDGDSNPVHNNDNTYDSQHLQDTPNRQVTKTCPNHVQNNKKSTDSTQNKDNITQAILEITKLDIPDTEKSRLINLLLQ